MKSKLINEALFFTLSGYAKQMVTVEDNYNSSIYNVAKSMNKYFNKPRAKYSKRKIEDISNCIKKKIEPQLAGKTAPSILLSVTLLYLLKEAKHLPTRLAFSHFVFEVEKYLEALELSEKYKGVVREHYRLFVNMGID